jgi:hypothetical protein
MASSVRTCRGSGIVAAVATPDGGVEATHVPSLMLTEMVAWIGDNHERAIMVTDHRLKGVRDHAASVIADRYTVDDTETF